MSYQKVTGCLSQGAHPGSYNGQDAYNDMLVIDESSKHGQWATAQHGDGRNGESSGLYARCPSNPHMGGGTEQVDELKDQIAGTLDASYYKGCGERQGVEREVVCMSDRKGHNGITEDGTATTLTAEEKDRPLAATSVVRRLTPLECERLQGYPDGWTDIGEWADSKGKKHKDADSPRYKALGNSIALPFWQWLARRIVAQYERDVTMASLFDGIGGFPLVFERCGAKAVWASEIEEFPIAVTKKHFPEEENK